jgi:ComF family protein
MHYYFQYILDLLFPHKRAGARIASLTAEQLLCHRNERALAKDGHEIQAYFSYGNPLIRDLIWALKYEDSEHAALLCGDAVAEYLLEMVSDSLLYGDTPLLIIPIPLSTQRERERGYNQVMRIATRAADALHGRALVCPALKRTRHTPLQSKLSRDKRLTNMVGAFALSEPSVVKGRHCILIDDVITTGSTLREAKKVLEAGDAASVTCIALAYA